MLALELDKSAVKDFMGQILREDIFDEFELRSADIATTVQVSIDGAGENGFSTWGVVRPLVYTIIKSCQKPRLVKLVFAYPNLEEIHPNAGALFLNLVYENDAVTFTTATAQREFALDKSLDHEWDSWVSQFFRDEKLSVSERE